MSDEVRCPKRSCVGRLRPSSYLEGKMYCMDPAKAHWVDDDGLEDLTCQNCERVWVRETKRGRKPKECPSCKG